MKNKTFKFDSREQKIWFTSDTHFGHNNIIKYCNRPFASADEMNEAIIKNWNSVVGENDIVFHLGDFSMNMGINNLMALRNRLHGKIYLIIGNHDWNNLEYDAFYESFEFVAPQMKIRIDDKTIYLNHFPFLCFDGSYKGMSSTWELFGHVHSSKTSNSGLDCQRLNMLFPSQYDVGCDNNSYTPISFEKVSEIINEQLLSQNLYRGSN